MVPTPTASANAPVSRQRCRTRATQLTILSAFVRSFVSSNSARQFEQLPQ